MSRLIFMALAAGMASMSAAQAQEGPLVSDMPVAKEHKTSQAPDAKQFAHQVSMTTLFEIEAARMATVRAKNPDTGMFAQQILNNQLKAQADLKVAAQEEGVPIASQLDQSHERKLRTLEDAEDEKFDQVFYRTQLDTQQANLKLLAAYGDNGQHEALRAYAQSYYSTTKMHFTQAKAVTAP